MSAPRRILPMIVLAVALGVACTGDGDGGRTPTPTASSTSPVPTGPVRFEPGHYRYEFGGVTADLVFDGSVATMDVKNTSGAELAPPALYVVDGSGKHQDGVVADAAPIPDGQSATFRVTFPDQVTEETIGLVILLFGDSNWGDLAPVPVA
ncbi:MAG: hypothetical protein ACXWEN_12155 [Actinomycetota bacterium]